MIARYFTAVASGFARKNILKRIEINNLALLNCFCNHKISTRGVAKHPARTRTTSSQNRLTFIEKALDNRKHMPQRIYDHGKSPSRSEGKPVVKHDHVGRCFYIDRDGLVCAYLDYEKRKGLIKIVGTEVSRAVKGRGYGKLLAQEALNFVAQNSYQLQIQCDFVRNYVLKDAPQYLKYIKH